MTRPCECGLATRPRRLFGFLVEPVDGAPCFFTGSIALGGCGLPSTDSLSGFVSAGNGKIQGGCGQVVDGTQTEMALGRLDAGDPEPRGLVVLLGLAAVVAGQAGITARPLAVAVVRLVVQHDDVPDAHQVGHDPLQHLPLGLGGVDLAVGALQQGAADPGHLHALAASEGVEVGDDDLGLCQFRAAFPFPLGLGTGVINSDRRRPATGGMSVGCPSGSRSWCHRGGS
jgi:hypothetical protein